MNLVSQWLPLERAFSSAIRREEYAAQVDTIDWVKADHYVRIGALATACVMLEDAGRKNSTEHIQVLFEIRNALIHNNGDLAKNRNSKALVDAQAYLAKSKHLDLSSSLASPYFSIVGTVVKLQPSIHFALRLFMR
jgi:hypothetical protein